jgi:hypothetical protein
VPVDAALHHRWRHHQGVLVHCREQAHGHQLPGPQVAVLVVELGLDPHRAGVGRYLVVDQRQVALAQQAALAVGIHERLHFRGRGGFEQFVQGRQVLLGQGELHGDRVDLGDAEQALSVAGAHQVARVDVADAHAAAYR